jgi:hypothetical protein
MSWGAQSRPKDAKTPSASGGRSEKPELEAISGAQVQQYAMPVFFCTGGDIRRAERNCTIPMKTMLVSACYYSTDALTRTCPATRRRVILLICGLGDAY